MNKTKLPTIKDGFLWGGSLSAVQVDGIGTPKRSPIWHDLLFQKYPNKHWAGIGPNVTIDFPNRYKEDLALYKEIGINSIRYGFMWSRLFPDGINLNEDAVQYYHDFIDDCHAHNIEPIMQLFHFDSPLWIKKLGGWTNPEVSKRFGKFAKFCFEEYGKKIDRFATFNEPAVMVGNFELPEWYEDENPTYERKWKEIIGLLRANAAAYYAWEEVKAKGNLKENASLGVVINYNKTYPLYDNPSEADIEAVKDMDAFMNILWTDGMVVGKINERVEEKLAKHGFTLPISEEDRRYISKIELDFIGENYYLPWRAAARTEEELKKEGKNPEYYLFKAGQKEGARLNKFRGWEIFPEGLTGTLKDIWNMYKKPIYIAENGMGVDNEERFRNEDGLIDDEYRTSFLKEHIVAVQDAIDLGVDIFGFHIWSMTDLWSSYNAFKNRYGMVEVNLNNNLERKLKKSAYWYKDFIVNGEIDNNYIKCDVITAKAMKESEELQKRQNIGKQNYESILSKEE